MILEQRPASFSPLFEAAGCFVWHDGHILMLERNEKGRPWGVPGGRLERGETMHQAIQREILEETGLDLTPDHVSTIYVDQEERQFVYHVFSIVLGSRPLVSLSHEHVSFRWVLPESVMDMSLVQDGWECVEKFCIR